MKRRLFPQGSVARRYHSLDYAAYPQGAGRVCNAAEAATASLSSRLALQKNPSVSFCSSISKADH